jgi:ribosomal protein S18 acetylase RimI-like enzyme
MLAVTIVEADLVRDEHQQAIVALLDAYARDPMGNGAPLTEGVKRRLIPGLRGHPTTLVFLAYLDVVPVGLAICFSGFSTFAARPLINIHDLAVLPEQRGRGIGRQLIDAVVQKAQALGCCKVTLEVQENTRTARRVYELAGFRQAVHQDAAGGALFMSKPL